MTPDQRQTIINDGTGILSEISFGFTIIQEALRLSQQSTHRDLWPNIQTAMRRLDDLAQVVLQLYDRDDTLSRAHSLGRFSKLPGERP